VRGEQQAGFGIRDTIDEANAAQDLVYLLEDLGRPTGVDLDLLLAVNERLGNWLGRSLPSRLAGTELARRR